MSAPASTKPLNFTSDRVGYETLRTNKLILGLMFALAVPAMLLMFALGETDFLSIYCGGIVIGSVMSALLALHARGLNKFAGFRTRGRVALDGDEISMRFLGDEDRPSPLPPRTIPLRDLVEGWIDPIEERVAVVRVRGGDLFTFEARSELAAQRALVALGLATGQRTVRAQVNAIAGRVPGATLLGFAALALVAPAVALFGVARFFSIFGEPLSWESVVDAIGGLGLSALAFVVAAGIAQLVIARVATVGADGIRIKSLFGSTFIALSDITGVRDLFGRVDLDLAGGGTRRIYASNDTAKLLATRVEEALNRATAARLATAQLERFDRRDETIADWRTRLLGAGQGYRDVGLERDDFFAVLDDPMSAPQRRIAAALALSTDKDDVTRDRLRLAVEACANEELAAALDQAAEGELDEARLERAIR